MKKRDTYLDSVKTILIYMVVLAHCLTRLGGVKEYSASESVLIFFSFINLIVMPLFSLVSGYFSNPDKSIWKSCVELFLIFALFQIVWTLINPPSSIHKLLSPAVTLWYLLSLCMWRAIIHYLNLVTKKKWIWLVLSLVLMNVAGFVPLTTEFSFQRTFSFLPFFILGTMMRKFEYAKWLNMKNKCLCGIVLVSFILFLLNYHPYSQWLLHGSNSFYRYHCALIFAPFVKILWMLSATIIGFAFLCVIPDSKLFSSQGNKTLTIYLFHFFPIYLLQEMGFRTNNPFYLIVLSLLIYIFTNLIHSFRFVRLIVSPLQIINKGYKKI